MPDKRRKRTDIVALWRGRARKIFAESSDAEVKTLARLIKHEQLTSEQMLYVLESAILDVWSEREADRQEEARIRRKRLRDNRVSHQARADWTERDDAIAQIQVPIPDSSEPQH